MPRGNLNRKDLENIITRRLRKLSTEEPNKQKKQKLSKLRKNFLEQKNLFTYAELNGLEKDREKTNVFINYLNTWILKNLNNKNNKTVKYKK